jgi:glycosyltransferase 2 family protein
VGEASAPRTVSRRVGGWAVKHRRPLLIGIGAAVLAVGTAALIGKAAGYARLLDSLRGADLNWLPLLAAGQIVAYAGYIMAYRATARVEGGPRLSFPLTTWIVGASFGAYAVANAVGALGVDYWALRRTGADHHAAFTRIIAFKTLEWAVFGVLVAALSAVMLAGGGPELKREVAVAWVVAVPFCYVAAYLATSPKRVDRLTDPGEGGRARGVFADTIASVAIVRTILGRPLSHLEAVAGAGLYWLGDLVTLWAGLRAFGVHIGLIALVLGYATGYAATMIPLPAGGVGGVDAAMTYALTLVGVPLGPALLGVFAYRFFNFWLPFIPGLLAGATVHAAYVRLPSVPHPAAGRPG